MADYDLRIHQNPDAMAWAKLYCEKNPEADEATMLGWFANAMMAMHDHLHGGGPLNGDHAQWMIDNPIPDTTTQS